MNRSDFRCKSDFDGSEIVAHLYEPDTPRKSYSIVFGHGFSENKERYRPIGEEFARNGVTAILPDLRGHGESKTEFYLEAMAKDTITLAKKLKQDFHTERVAAGGVSMGAYTTALAQTYDEGRIIDGEVLVMIPRNFKKYVEKFPGYKPLRYSILRSLAKTPVGFAIKLKDKRLGKTSLFGGGIKFESLRVYDICKFVKEIDNSLDIVNMFRNGSHASIPTLLVCDHNEKDLLHDGRDSEELYAAMVESKNGSAEIQLHVTDHDIGRDLTGEVIRSIIHRSVEFFDTNLTRNLAY